MGMSGCDPGGFQSEINVTPLVDVVLVLLIIFMVIVPLAMHGYDVDIPGEAITTTDVEPTDDQVVLAIDAGSCAVVSPPSVAGLPEGCRVRVNDDEVAVVDLADRMVEIFGPRDAAGRVLFLAADDELNYEGVMRILDVAKSRVRDLRIGLVTESPRPELAGRSV